MKKRKMLFYITLLLTCVLIIAFIQVPSPYNTLNTLESIWIEIKEETVSPTGLEIVFHNNSTNMNEFIYGAWYVLEVYRNGRWVKLRPYSELPIPWWAAYVHTSKELEQGGLPSVPGGYQPNEMGYEWEARYGKLRRGEYRIVIIVSSTRAIPIGDTSLNKYYLSASFNETVKKSL